MNSKCPVTGGQCPFDKTKFDRMTQQIDQIHTTIFGAEGQGGLHRRVDVCESRLDSLRLHTAKTAGWIAAVAAGISFAGAKIWDKLIK